VTRPPDPARPRSPAPQNERQRTVNAIREVLAEVVRSGKLPSTDDVDPIFTRGLISEIQEAKRGLQREALRIRNAQQDDDHSDIEDVVDDIIGAAVAKYGHLTKADRNREEAVPEAPTGPDTEGVEGRRRAAQDQRKRVAPLREILALAGRAGGVDGRDLDSLNLRPDTTDEQRVKWRGDVVAAGKRVVRLYNGGNLQESRRLAEDLAERLSAQLAETEPHRDPMADVEDPRQLADAIRGKQVR
jgi:hypothetical protein